MNGVEHIKSAPCYENYRWVENDGPTEETWNYGTDNGINNTTINILVHKSQIIFLG